MTFFCFGERHKIQEKDASISTMTSFFLRKPKFWQKISAPLIEKAPGAEAFSH